MSADGLRWSRICTAPKPPPFEPASVARSVSPLSVNANERNLIPGRKTPFSGGLNGVPPFPTEATASTRLEWIDALDALEPRAVVAGHKIPQNDDDPRNTAETRQYLRDFIRLDQTTDTPRELFEAMIKLYPEHANPGSLWGGANAGKSEAGNGSARAVTTAARDEQGDALEQGCGDERWRSRAAHG